MQYSLAKWRPNPIVSLLLLSAQYLLSLLLPPWPLLDPAETHTNQARLRILEFFHFPRHIVMLTQRRTHKYSRIYQWICTPFQVPPPHSWKLFHRAPLPNLSGQSSYRVRIRIRPAWAKFKSLFMIVKSYGKCVETNVFELEKRIFFVEHVCLFWTRDG